MFKAIAVLIFGLFTSQAFAIPIQGGEGLKLTGSNPVGTIYIEGDATTDESWRIVSSDSPDELSFEHFEPFVESDITLNEAKVTTVEAFGYTPTSKYLASVTTDSRSDNSTPAGINGDMAGRVIEFDGTIWLNFDDQWIQKGAFSNSLTTDRLMARRTILLNTDPNDATVHLPTPLKGTSIGSRNTASDASGTEIISFTDLNGDFGHLVEMLHNSSSDKLNQMLGIKLDNTMVGVPYELDYVSGATFAVGDVIVDQGIRYICNTAGAQSGLFTANTSLWDAVSYTATAGDVSVSGTPVNNQLAVWIDSTTIEGDSNITWDGDSLDIGGTNRINFNGTLLEIHHGGSNAFITNTTGALAIASAGGLNLSSSAGTITLEPTNGHPVTGVPQTSTTGQLASTSALSGRDAGLYVRSINPQIAVQETDASANEQIWVMMSEAGLFKIGAYNEASNLRDDAITITRTLNIVDDVNILVPLNVTGDTAITGDLSATGIIKTGDGTVSLPAYSFTSDIDTGIYRDSAGVLAVTSNGAAILKTSAIDSTKLAHMLVSLDFDTDNERPFITFGLVTTEVESAFFITSGSTGELSLNPGSSDAAVQIGRAIATGQGILQVATDGHVTIGTQTNLFGVIGDGDVLVLGAKTSDATKTRMTWESPADNDQFRIGINNVAVDSGSVFLDYPDGTEFRIKTSAGTAISISSLDIDLGGDVDMVGDLFIGDTTDHATIAVNTGFDLSTISFDSISFSILSEETNAQGIAFNSDGSKMYIVGQGNDAVFEYDLGTNFNVSTAVYNSITLSVSGQDATPRDVSFNTLGTRMHILGASGDRIYQYTLTTGFDLSTASYDNASFSVTSQETGPTGLDFSTDGTKLYIVGANDTVYQYSLTSAFDIGTASYDSVSFNATAQDTNYRDVRLNADGKKMFLLGAATESLYQYSLTTAFDVSTAIYDSVSFSVSNEEETPRCFEFNSTGTAVFILGTTNDSVFQYTISPSLSIIPTAELTAIIGSFSVKTDNADTVSVLNLTTSGTNGGTTSIFVGDQDPNGTITGVGGDIYVKDSAALSNMFFSKEATTGTGWETVSILPSTVNQLFSTAEYEALGTVSVITTADVTRSLRFHGSVTSSTKHTITQSSIEAELQFIDPTEGNQMIYTGTATFITAAAGGDVTMRNSALIAATAGTQLFDYVGEGRLAGVDIIEITQSANLARWDLGTIGRVSTAEVGPIVTISGGSAITDTTSGLVLDSVSLFAMDTIFFDQTDEAGSSATMVTINNSAYKTGRATLFTSSGHLYSGEHLLRINPGLPDDYRVNVFNTNMILHGTAAIFDTSGSTGSFSAVSNNSLSATAITSVTDSSDVAQFEHSGTSPPLGSLVTISGFSTNTSYNTTGVVTVSNAASFQVDYVAFGTTETGSYLQTGVTITATAHGLTQGTGVTLDTTLSTDFDGGCLIFNIQTNSFDCPLTFTSTHAGTWSTEGLDQESERVTAFNNPGTSNSKMLGFGSVNGRTGETTITDGTYAAIACSTFAQNFVTQLFKLINTATCLWEYTGLEPFQGFLTGGLWALKSGSTANYRFAISINATVPTFATALYAPMEVKTTKVSIPLNFPAELTLADTIQIMAAGDGTANNLTITDLIFGIQ